MLNLDRSFIERNINIQNVISIVILLVFLPKVLLLLSNSQVMQLGFSYRYPFYCKCSHWPQLQNCDKDASVCQWKGKQHGKLFFPIRNLRSPDTCANGRQNKWLIISHKDRDTPHVETLGPHGSLLLSEQVSTT